MLLRKILLLLFLFPFSATFAQDVEKKLIMVLPDTSADKLLTADVSFGPGNEFCFYYPDSGTLTTRMKTYGPFLQPGRRELFRVYHNAETNERYVKSANSATVFGPYYATIHYALTKPQGTAYAVIFKDSADYYINGVRIATTARSDYIDRSFAWINGWCAFSDGGQALYTIKKGKWNYLFINNRLLDSSLHYYSMLDIDDKGNYFYALGNFEGTGHDFYRFKAIPHEAKKVLRPLEAWNSRVWVYDDKETIFYYGNSNGTDHLRVSPFDKPVNGSTIKVLAKGNAIFGYRLSPRQARTAYDAPGSSPTRICLNGTGRDLPYEEISLPCIDSPGNYALFGLRDYYLYKNINGEEVKQPLSKHGVRAKPISIDVHGNTICYYETDDSVYVYQNDRLFGSCPVSQFALLLQHSHIWGNDVNDERLPVLCIGNTSYIIYNNTFSPPMLSIDETRYGYSRGVYETGEAIYGNVGKYGYWLLQKTGMQKYDLFINHRRISLPPGVNFEGPLCRQLVNSCRLTANEFIYYSMEGYNIYRYKITL